MRTFDPAQLCPSLTHDALTIASLQGFGAGLFIGATALIWMLVLRRKKINGRSNKNEALERIREIVTGLERYSFSVVKITIDKNDIPRFGGDLAALVSEVDTHRAEKRAAEYVASIP